MFGYDIFISYASVDREWAMYLNERLTASARKLSTFFDHQSLRAGDDWEAQIEAGLNTSQHLIVLWSSNAKDSAWVSREIATFYTLAKPRANPERRLIFFNLQGENPAYKALQQISVPALQTAYADSQLPALAV